MFSELTNYFNIEMRISIKTKGTLDDDLLKIIE